MLKGAFIAAGAFAVTFVATALASQAAMAGTPNCLSKANRHVACTDRFKANTQQRRGNGRVKKVGALKTEKILSIR